LLAVFEDLRGVHYEVSEIIRVFSTELKMPERAIVS